MAKLRQDVEDTLIPIIRCCEKQCSKKDRTYRFVRRRINVYLCFSHITKCLLKEYEEKE